MEKCSVHVCTLGVYARGHCQRHYREYLQYDADRPQCSVDGCTTAAACRTYCRRHYRRWLRHGDPTYLSRYRGEEPTPHDRITYAGWHRNTIPMPTIDLDVQRRYVAQNERDGYLMSPEYLAAVRSWRGESLDIAAD